MLWVTWNLFFSFSTCYFCELVHSLMLRGWVTFHYLITFIILTKSVVSDMKFVFLILYLLLLWTCAFTYTQLVSYFSLLHNLSFSQKVWWVTWNLFFSLSTCYFCELVHSLMHRRYVTFHYFITFIILTQSVVSDMKFFLHLILMWTCTFAYAQGVSYFSLPHNFYHSDKKCGEWYEICFSLSLLATSVNLCIHLCSVGKLLFITSWLLSFWQKVWWVTWNFCFSFSICYFCELVHSLLLSW